MCTWDHNEFNKLYDFKRYIELQGQFKAAGNMPAEMTASAVFHLLSVSNTTSIEYITDIQMYLSSLVILYVTYISLITGQTLYLVPIICLLHYNSVSRYCAMLNCTFYRYI